ncbi:MAG: recombination protein RecR [Bacteroidales bacterium]|nr:recombination protein RecR [Bacteroidales bacterium]MBR0054052.1 recombination protein RecR [Bacteroidales bacterium]
METGFSKQLDDAILEISKLPGIGKRTALRLALHILKMDGNEVALLAGAITALKEKVCYCKECHNLSDTEICDICGNPKRNKQIVCVVQDIRDVVAIENTHQYNGVYHVLGGIIAPMDGIGPKDLNLDSLFERVDHGGISEVILALPATVDGDTTNFYIYNNIRGKIPIVTTIARGIGIGEELEYTDEVTLGRSLLSRTDFEQSYLKH